MRRTISLAAVLLGLLLGSGVARAQYFGQNKVQYRDFDFQVLETKNFDIHYYPEEKENAEHVARMAERWYARLSSLFGHRLDRRQPLILYASAPDFRQTNSTPGDVGEGTGGFTDAFKRRIVMPSAGPLAETDHVLGHELVHAFQFDISSRGANNSAVPVALRLPLWFIEGMAEYVSVGPVDPLTAMWMRDACRKEKLPAIKDLGHPKYFPYRWGQALFAFVGGKWGDSAVADLMKAAGRSGDLEGAFKLVLKTDSKELSKQWHEALRATYGPFLETHRLASYYGPAVISEKNGGELNVGPSLSPDGKRVVFLSERSLFSVDLFLADMATGKIRQKLFSNATNPHFDSLQFIDSAGDWNGTGDRFAFTAIRSGHAALVIADPDRPGSEKEISLPDLPQAWDPTWSPDGKALAFAAQKGGLLDLYVYDLGAGTTRRLTRDAYAELQPSWSPDGRKIAFVTDRFSTRLPDLAYGNYRLATIDVKTGEIEALPFFEKAKHVDPQWSSGGQSLYFVSDRSGVSNVYRLDLGAGQVYQVTDLVTGVTGITALSPSLSVARSARGLVFAVREDDKYRIHRIDDEEKLAGTAVQTPPSTTAALLPPVERRSQEVEAFREEPTRGLPKAAPTAVKPYKPRLTVDFVGSPSIEVGADRLGGYVGGGTSLSFSDMLGDRNLTAVINANGRLQDIGGQLVFTNLKSKWDWGVGASRIPYLTAGAFTQSVGQINGEPAIVEQFLEQRQTDQSVFGIVSRPFNRALRLDVAGAYRRISFSGRVDSQAFSLVDGRLLAERRDDLPSASALNLAESSAAVVYDTSVFGATSPILGRRFRIEASPTFGTLNYTGVLADFRQYYMPVRPFTVAFRALHYGRYGRDAGDPRFFDLFLGYPYLVRGYDNGSFDFSECDAAGRCAVYERLFGTRSLVGNVEVRFPLLGLFGAKNLYGPLPIELAFFADGGVAWSGGEKPSLLGGDRKGVASVGVTARVNVLGFVVVAVDFAKPLARPQKGWIWQFSFTPGF